MKIINQIISFFINFFVKPSRDELKSKSMMIDHNIVYKNHKYSTNYIKDKKNKLIVELDENIYFLSDLFEALNQTPYKNERNKVIELKKQTEICRRVLLKLDPNKIYYKNTLNSIRRHCKIVSSLRYD